VFVSSAEAEEPTAIASAEATRVVAE